MDEETKIKILNAIYSEGKPLEALDISRKINVALREVCESLIELEKEMKVKVTRKGKYINTDFLHGKVSITKSGVGFVTNLVYPDVYIRKENTLHALNGDNVIFQMTNKEKMEGKIVKIVSHNQEYEVGQVILRGNKKFIKLDDLRKNNILIQCNDDQLLPGYKVLVQVGNFIKPDIYDGEVIRVIGHINDPGMDIKSKVLAYGFEIDFPENVLKEVEKIPTVVREEDLVGRRDLRDKILFTIDKETAKDLDDAISIEILPNGNYLLRVSIAHVPYYIEEGGAIDKNAEKRATSIYFPGGCIPMLHPKISNGICSLNENVDRLARTTVMEYDQTGKQVSYEVFLSVINSKKKMTYEKVEECFKNQCADSEYVPFIDSLKVGQALASILRKNRIDNGAIDFGTAEQEIIVDENGKVIDVIKRERLESERMIEEFMIANDTTIAMHAKYLGIPFEYRVHGDPNVDKLEEFIKFARYMKQKLPSIPKNMHSGAIKNILDSLRGSPDFEIYSYLLLRCMKKAKYNTENTGHFALAADVHTHFTAPIRRNPDFKNHRIFDMFEKEYTIDEQEIKKLTEELSSLATHSSQMELMVDDLEREITKMKFAQYMEDHIGEAFVGKITGVTSFGFYVDFYNGIEGLVKIEDLTKSMFDETTYTIYTSDKTYRIGDKVEVTVDSVNSFAGHINLALSHKIEQVEGIKKKKIYTENKFLNNIINVIHYYIIDCRRTFKEIIALTNISPEELLGYIDELNKAGNQQIILYYINGEPEIDYENMIYKIHYLPWPKKELKITFGADKHIGHVCDRIKYINEVYDWHAKRSGDYFFDLGDIFHGPIERAKDPKQVRIGNLEESITELKRYHPNYLTTHFITGNHDTAYNEINQCNIGRLIEAECPNMIFLNDLFTCLDIGGLRINLSHGHIEYQHLDKIKLHKEHNFLTVNNPHIIAQGHFHLGNISLSPEEILLCQTPGLMMSKRNVGNSMGALSLTVYDDHDSFDIEYEMKLLSENVKGEVTLKKDLNNRK